MKTGILALLVLLAVSQSEALRCYCGGTTKYCRNPVETCVGSNKVCASVILTVGPHVSWFKGCYGESDCKILNQPPRSTSTCCTQDLCN